MRGYVVSMVTVAGLLSSTCAGAISEDRVLVVVNAASPVSHYVADLYREYHPGIPARNVIELQGIPDVTSSASEIISRYEFESRIAQPIRRYLVQNNMVDRIWVIVTTAGMPYRIADTKISSAVQPAASMYDEYAEAHLVNAASVESELAVLFQIDPELDRPQRAPLQARLVNPYHGYVSPFDAFAGQRDVLGRRGQFCFGIIASGSDQVYEGEECTDPDSDCWNNYRATQGRLFAARDMYLVARLDGPRRAGTSEQTRELPLAAIRRMLESSARVSGAQGYGHDPDRSALVLNDDNVILLQNQWPNAGYAIAWDAHPSDYLKASEYPTPPNVTSNGPNKDDMRVGFRSLTGSSSLPSRYTGTVLRGATAPGLLVSEVTFDALNLMQNQSHVHAGWGVVGAATIGMNAGDGRSRTYVLNGGPGGSRLFEPTYGAVFTTADSWTGVTFFTDRWTSQAKAVDWLAIGGGGTIGYAVEPRSSSLVDNDLLQWNYLYDGDGDGWADMTFVEAAHTALPFVSWSAVVIGDPLMRVRVGTGAKSCIAPVAAVGDLNWDGQVDAAELAAAEQLCGQAMNTSVGDGGYDDRADIDQNGTVEPDDLAVLVALGSGG